MVAAFRDVTGARIADEITDVRHGAAGPATVSMDDFPKPGQISLGRALHLDFRRSELQLFWLAHSGIGLVISRSASDNNLSTRAALRQMISGCLW